MDQTTLWLDPRLWVAIGFFGQALFMSRMLVQWVVADAGAMRSCRSSSGG